MHADKGIEERVVKMGALTGNKNGSIFSDRVNLLLIILIALVAADGVISHFLITEHLALEANPLIRRWVAEDFFPVIKLGGGFLAAVLLWLIYRRRPKLSQAVLLSSVIFYTAILYWNLLTFVVVATI
jgi:hypothetical protein